jgi:hypothetical protein
MSNGERTSSLTLTGFAWRLLLALVLVLITYNPTHFSFLDWLRASINGRTMGPEHAVAGIALFGGWLFVITATRRALGSLGLIVLIAFIGALIWWLVDVGWLNAASRSSIEWIVLIGLAVLLAVGMSWALIWRRVTGQVTVDDVHQ